MCVWVYLHTYARVCKKRESLLAYLNEVEFCYFEHNK